MAKLIECWKYAKKSLVKIFTILTNVVTQDKHIVNVRPNHRGHVHAVLGRHHVKNLPVAAVHEELANYGVTHEASIVHTVIHKKEHGGGFAVCYIPFLTLYDLLDGIAVIVTKYENIRNKLLVVTITILRTRHGDSRWYVPLVPKNISHEGRLARTTLSDEDAHFVIRYFTRIEFLQLNVHSCFTLRVLPVSWGALAFLIEISSWSKAGMSAGAVQLAAIGQQDAYLTGKPSVSYFAGVYRRHTPFSLQAFNVPFQGQQIQWGSQAVCRIPYKGDLVRSVMLSVTLPSLAPASGDYIWKLPVSQQRPVPYLYFDGNLNLPNTVNIANLDTFSTGTVAAWLTGSSLGTRVFYNSQVGKFYFQNCSNVTVNTADVTDVGVFWGLDPHNYARFPTANTVQWDVSSGSSHGNYSDLSVSQSGWIPEAAAAGVNSSETYYTNVYTDTTLQFVVPSPTGRWAQFLDFSLFGPSQSTQSLIKITEGGCFQFSVTGTYMVILTLRVSAPVVRIGIGHGAYDGHPVGSWSWNDYRYDFIVSPGPQTPLAVIPITCTDVTQFFFIDLETLTSDGITIGSLTSGTEIAITDINEIYSLNTTQALVNKTANLAVNWTRSGVIQNLKVSSISNTFSFLTSGLFHLQCSLLTTGSNIISVTLNDTSLGPIRTWQTTQSRSPTIHFTLPVVVPSTTNNYTLSITSDSAATLASNSFIGCEQFGVLQSTTSLNSKRNGLLFTGNALSQFTQGTLKPINFKTMFSNVGVSNFISVTSNGNIQFSNTGAYRFTVYFDTSNSYVSNVGIFKSFNDVRPASPSYQATSPLNIGTQGPYTIDVFAQCATPTEVFYLDVTTIGTGVTNVTANAYVTVVGVASATPNSYNYVDSVGTYLIDKAELKIGGQLIQTLEGEAIEIYNDLTIPEENQSSLTLMTGKLDPSTSFQDRTYLVNLPFYFYGASELAVPVCALQRQDMEIYVTFRPFLSLVANNTVVNQTSVTASMIVEYAYLSDPEISWMQSHILDYVITQTQYASYDLGQSTVVDLDFMGPIRELFFVIQDDDATPYVYVLDRGLGVTITLNGEDLLDPTTADYNFLHLIQPLEKHSRQPDRTVYMYSFARRPQDPRPSGSINFSRIKQKKFQINLPGTSSLSTKNLRIIAVSYNFLRISNGLAGLLYE